MGEYKGLGWVHADALPWGRKDHHFKKQHFVDAACIMPSEYLRTDFFCVLTVWYIHL